MAGFDDYVKQRLREQKQTQVQPSQQSGGFEDYVRQREGVSASQPAPAQKMTTVREAAAQAAALQTAANKAAAAMSGVPGSSASRALQALAASTAARSVAKNTAAAKPQVATLAGVPTAMLSEQGQRALELGRVEGEGRGTRTYVNKSPTGLTGADLTKAVLRQRVESNSQKRKADELAKSLLDQIRAAGGPTAAGGTQQLQKQGTKTVSPRLGGTETQNLPVVNRDELRKQYYEVLPQTSGFDEMSKEIPRAASLGDNGDFSAEDIRKYRQWASSKEGWTKNFEYPTMDRNLAEYNARVKPSLASGGDTGSYGAQLNELMTDQEYATGVYLYNAQGMDAYLDWLDSMYDTLRERERNRSLGIIDAATKDTPVIGTVAARGANVINEALGGAYVAKQTGKALLDLARTGRWNGVQLDPNNRAYDAGIARDALQRADLERVSALGRQAGWLGELPGQAARFVMRQRGVNDQAAEQLTGGLKDTGLAGEQMARFVYQGVTSQLDSVTNRMLFGEAGTVLMGAGAMADMTRETIEQGGTADQAMIKGIIAGLLETWTESKSFERISSIWQMGKEGADGIVRQIVKSMASEANEEMASEIGNIFTDLIVMGDESEWRDKVRQYMDMGLTKDEAANRALADMAGQVVEAGAGGAFGGLLGEGGSYAVSRLYNGIARGLNNRGVEKLAGDYAGETRQAFIKNYNPAQLTPDEYKRMFDIVHQQGADGKTLQQVEEIAPNIVAALGREQAARIIERGAADAMASGAQDNRQQAAQETENVAETAEQPAGERTAEQVLAGTGAEATVRAAERGEETQDVSAPAAETQETSGGVVRTYSAEKLTRAQETELNALDAIGKHYGVEFEIVDTLDGANGMYVRTEDGKRKFAVALDALEGAYVQAGVHELTHYIAETDKEGYSVVERTVLDRLNESGGFDLAGEVAKRIGQYADRGVTLTEQDAREEIVAEAIPQVFADDTVVREFVNENPSLAQKIRDWISDFINTIRDGIARYAQRSGRSEIKALWNDVEALTAIRDAFDAAMQRANNNAQTAAEAQTVAVETEQTAAKAEQETAKAERETRETEQAAEAAPEREAASLAEEEAEESEETIYGVVRSDTVENLTRAQEILLDAVDAIAKRYRVRINTVDTLGDFGAEYWGNGLFLLAMDASDHAYFHYCIHEMVHYISDNDHDAYLNLEKIVLDRLEKSGNFDLRSEVEKRIADYRAAGKELDERAAREEIVAEAVPTVFGNENVVREFVNENPSLAQRIRDWISDFIDTIKDSIAKHAKSGDRSEMKALWDDVEALTEIRDAFDNAMQQAVDRYERRQERIMQEIAEERAQKESETESDDGEIVMPAKDGRPAIRVISNFDRQMQAAVEDRGYQPDEDEEGAQYVDTDRVEAEEKAPGVEREYTGYVSRESRTFLRGLDDFAKKYGMKIKIVDRLDGPQCVSLGHGEFVMSTRAVSDYDGIAHMAVSTMLDWLRNENPSGYQEIEAAALRVAQDVQDAFEAEGMQTFDVLKEAQRLADQETARGVPMDFEQGYRQIAAEAVTSVLMDRDAVRELVGENFGLMRRIRDFIDNFVKSLGEMFVRYVDAEEGNGIIGIALDGDKAALGKIARTVREALENRVRETAEARAELAERGFAINEDMDTVYADAVKYSERSWREDEKNYYRDRQRAAKLMAAVINVSEEDCLRYIQNIDSIAARIAMDRDRLDYDPEREYSALKSNSEYVWTVDFSTLCKKRLLFTGTFDAIQKRFKDAQFTEDDIIRLREMMAEKGYEVACAFCYVESRRKKNGPIIEEFLKKYREAVEGSGEMTLGPSNRQKNFKADKSWIPEIADFNTTEGITNVIKNHHDVYEAYMYFMNARGTSKPKLVENMTDYRNEILDNYLTKKGLPNKRKVNSMNKRGGLRLQSFSDFQLINLIDMMQVVTDMARVGLKSQAYTKVPAFGWIFGGTGVKINLSLVAKGVDENGNLIFDDVEGMPHEEAFRIRDYHSKNVGTILVAGNDAVVRAAMKDPRIDFIIPYHRSGWTKDNEQKLGLGAYEDFTAYQNEKDAETEKKAKNNIFPSEYWDYSLTGDQNAQKYLALCKQRHVKPKFEQYAGMPGYWKMLIDFKMYDNDGNGSEQTAVRPDVNMDMVMRYLDEYRGEYSGPMVAQDVVEEFSSEYAKEMEKRGAKFSLVTTDEDVNVDGVIDGEAAQAVQEAEEAAEKKRPRRSGSAGLEGTEKTAARLAKQILKKAESKYDEAKMAESIVKLTDEIALNGAGKDTLQAATNLMKEVLKEVKTSDPYYGEASDAARRAIRSTKIRLSKDQYEFIKRRFGTLTDFKKMVGSVFTLSTQAGIPIDTAWQEFAETAAGLVDPELQNVEDMIESMPFVAESLRPKTVGLDSIGYDIDAGAVEMALELQAEILKHIADVGGEKAKAYAQIGSELKRYRARADEKVAQAEERAALAEERAAIALEGTDKKIDTGALEKSAQERADKLREINAGLIDENRDLAGQLLDERHKSRDFEALKNVNAGLIDQNTKLSADLFYTRQQARQAALGFQKAADQLRADYQLKLQQEMQRIRQRRRQTFDDIAQKLRAADAAKDAEAAAEAMKEYRFEMKRIDAEQAEAMARITVRRQTEDQSKRAHAYTRIRRSADALKKALEKPDKKNYIPLKLQESVLGMLQSLDFTKDGRKMTEGAQQWRKSLQDIADYLARQLDIQNNVTTDDTGHEGIWMSLCEDQIITLQECADVIKGAGKSIPDMTLAEMNEISNAMSIIRHAIETINTMWANARYQTADEAGQATLKDLKNRPSNKAQEGPLRGLDDLLNVRNLDAGSFFERLGEGGESIYQELREGQDKAFGRIREASERVPQILGITAKNKAKRFAELRKWGADKHTFDVPMLVDGKAQTMKLELTSWELMDLYNHTKRGQSLKHILNGGLVRDAAKGELANRRVKVDEDFVRNMVNELTQDQKETADKMMGYLSGDVAEWGNAVSMKMYLIRMFNDRFYWPIKTVRTARGKREATAEAPRFNALKNAGFTKQLQDNVSDPLVIRDGLTSFIEHIGQMANYSGLTMPIDDMLRWVNYKVRDENGSIDYDNVLLSEVERVLGKEAERYLDRLMDDLNGMGEKSREFKGLSRLLSNAKRAAVMAKIRVVLQQPTAILRAAAMINPWYLRDWVFGVWKKTIREMQEHSELAWWKSNGNYEIGTGKSMQSILTGMAETRRAAAMDKMGAAAGFADDLGWGAIWRAVKRETAREHKDLVKGTDEYWRHVKERFEEVCTKTQVIDTVLTRSDLMRSKTSLMQQSTAFMSEPTKQVNMIRSAMSEWNRARRAGDKAGMRKAAGRIARSTAAIAASAALTSVMTAMFDAWRYWNPDEEDEEGNPVTLIDKMLGNWSEDFADNMNPLANIPFVKDMWAILQGEDVERMDMAAMNDMVKAASRLARYLQGNDYGYTAWSAIKPTITSAGDLLGLPVSGLVQDAEFAMNILAPGATRTYEPDKARGAALDILYEAMLSGDQKKINEARNSLLNGKYGRAPMTAEEIDRQLADMLAEDDDRIRELYELKDDPDAGSRRVDLMNAVQKDGFSYEIVKKAADRYDEVTIKALKKDYLEAVEGEDADTAETLKQDLIDFGVKEETIDGWAKDPDAEAELEAPKPTYMELYQMVRAKEKDEEKRIRDALYAAGDSREDTSKGLADVLATADDRVRLAYEAQQDGQAARVKQLKAQMQAAGFSEAEVSQAVKRYPELKKAEYKAGYLEAKADGDRNAMAKYEKQLLDMGVKQETIAAYGTEKDPDAELAGVKEWKNDNLWAAIRSDEATDADIADIAAYLMANSDAKDPAKSLASSASSEFKKDYVDMVQNGQLVEAEELRDKLASIGVKETTMQSWVTDNLKSEYVDLVQSGKTSEANAMKKNMMDAGVDAEKIDGWAPAVEKKDNRETLIADIDAGETDSAARQAQQMIADGLYTKSGLVSSLNSQYVETWCRLMDAGKKTEAEQLQRTLMGLNLKKTDGTNYYAPSWWSEQYAKWRTESK